MKLTELAASALDKYLSKGGTPRSMTLWVNADGTYNLPNFGGPRPFIKKYWTFISFDDLCIETGYTFFAIDANDGKSNARFPLFVMRSYDTLEETAAGSKTFYYKEKHDLLLQAALDATDIEATKAPIVAPKGKWVICVGGNSLSPPLVEWIEE